MGQDTGQPSGLQSEISGKTGHQIKHLLIARAIIAALLMLTIAYFYFYPLPRMQRGMLVTAVLLQALLLLVQWKLTNTRVSQGVQIGFQLLGDMFLVSVLVFVTDGLASPFVLLFGLLIIAAGTQMQVMLSLTVALAASGCYLGSVYIAAWHDQHALSVNESLSVLMQVSALLLVGGVMGYIARRQQRLLVEGSQVVRMHRKLKALHGQVMETMHDGVLVLDEAYYISDCNRAACSMLAAGSDIQGMLLPMVMQLPAQLQHFFEDGNRHACRCEYEKQGRVLLIMAVQMPEGNEQAKWLMSLVDITDFRQLEQKLAGQERLAAMGRMAAMLAHEIRNPLQSIGQAVEILSEGKSHQRREVGNIMREEVQRLDHLVSDMLDYAKPLYPKPEPVAVSDVIHAAIKQVDAQGNMDIHLNCTISELEIDTSHLRLVLDNLLRNAMHASPAVGSIHIRMTGDGQWKLEVEDEGGGVPEAMRQHVFEPFVSGKVDGAGLGLATVWQVCQSNGWKITVGDSNGKDEKKGAIFTVTGPLYTAENRSEGEEFGQRITG
ncbi:MAG: ATP-binding protein [Zetaproteobacteria bacterium]|nr:MAG: ATP-binding protein [Zetaproteobacteria bacterium]